MEIEYPTLLRLIRIQWHLVVSSRAVQHPLEVQYELSAGLGSATGCLEKPTDKWRREGV